MYKIHKILINDEQLYKILNEKLGAEEAKSIKEQVAKKGVKQLNDDTNVLATQTELLAMEHRLKQTIYIACVVLFVAILGSLLLLLKQNKP